MVNGALHPIHSGGGSFSKIKECVRREWPSRSLVRTTSSLLLLQCGWKCFVRSGNFSFNLLFCISSQLFFLISRIYLFAFGLQSDAGTEVTVTGPWKPDVTTSKTTSNSRLCAYVYI